MAKGKEAVASVQQLPQKIMDGIKSQFMKIPTMINEKPQTLMAQTKSKFEEAIKALKFKKTQFLKTMVQWEVSELKEMAETNIVVGKAIEVTEKTLAFSLTTCERTWQGKHW